MKFTKGHGLGNDFILVSLFEEYVPEPGSLAPLICDRHTGVGADGLIILAPSASADVRMITYNADGSRARMCGNGIRCLARYAVEHGLVAGTILHVETDAGIKRAECQVVDHNVQAVRIDMGQPVFDPAALPAAVDADRLVDHLLEVAGTRYRFTCVSMGNPHAVVFVDDLKAIDVDSLGPRIEHHPLFPDRINAQFAHVQSPRRVIIKTWERGCGATRACGTGACAVCAAGAVTGRTGRCITATLPGGDLEIEWAGDDHVYMTGPAVEVFTGEWPG